MASSGSYNSDRNPSAEIDFASDPASGSFFSSEYKKHEDLRQMLDGNKDGLKLEAMKRIIGMVAKGRDATDLFPAVVKNVVSSNLEVKKLVYVYLVRYAEEQQDLALLSISTFQRALKDPNQLIRACALRVLSSIRVPVIVPIMMLAIKEAVTDMSPYVRKTAAHAIPKLYNLDPEQKEELILVIEKLLSDKTTLVMGSAVMAFEEVCPERIDLIHKNYRKLCGLLVDIEEWGQVVIMTMLTRYARTQFVDPNLGVDMEETAWAFYDDNEERDAHLDESLPKSISKRAMDPDHRLLLRNTKPLLQSRNAAVVLAVAQLYQHVAPHTEVAQVARALVRLLRSHREVQAVVLTNIASLSTQRKGMFDPFLKSFFVRSSDPTHIKILKLEVLTNLATEGNISMILRELQTYIGSSDKEFVAATIQAIGRCAANIKEVTDTCLNGLVTLLSHRDELVVGESIIVVRKLLQSDTVGHKEIISHMARLVDNIKMPTARASILWLLGEYCEKVPKIAPDMLRKMAKSFVNEEDIVKLQIVTLATKLYLTNPKQTHLLCQYVYNLAKYDTNYDIRDRARLVRCLIFPTAEQENNKFLKYTKKIFLAHKPPPVQQSSFKDRHHYQLGTLSHFINARATGYRDLPPFPKEAPDPGVRNVEETPSWTSTKPCLFHRGKAVKEKKFYSDESESESKTASSCNESESESELETKSSSSSERESKSEEDQVKQTKEMAKVSEKDGEASEQSSSEESGSSGSTSSSESDSEESSGGSDDNQPKPKVGPEDVSAPKAIPKSNFDLLLDLDSSPPIDASVLTPSLGGLLTPSSFIEPVALPSMQIACPVYIPKSGQEILNRLSGGGLSISARFTRSQHLYLPSMTSIELTFTNHSTEDLADICTGSKRLSPGMSMHEFATIATLQPGTSLHGTMGVDFNDSTQPANFDIIASNNTYPISLAPPIGELLHPLCITEADFNLHQGKLKGMTESSCSVSISPIYCNPTKLVEKVHQMANVLQVPSTEDAIYKFGGQTTSGKTLVLISVTEPSAKNEVRITVNCEKIVISSMLLKHLQTEFTK